MTSDQKQQKSLDSSRLDSLPPDLREKVRRWLELPKGRRIQAIRTVISHFVRRAEEAGPIVAWLEFTDWMGSEDGSIMFPHMFREEFREEAVLLYYGYLKLMESLRPVIRNYFDLVLKALTSVNLKSN